MRFGRLRMAIRRRLNRRYRPALVGNEYQKVLVGQRLFGDSLREEQ
jgi:hypothetical protein